MTNPKKSRRAPRPGHPGQAIAELMALHGIDRRQLHLATHMDIMRVYNLLDGTRDITADTAARLGIFFETDPRYWLHLQADYDLKAIDMAPISHEIHPVSTNRWKTLPRQRQRRPSTRK